ncbi:MAG: M81 family metallopeptidase [Planctomycetota bacterium]
MPRIVVAECKQEVSSFNPARSDYADFRVVRGPDLIKHHRQVREEVGGALQVFAQDSTIEVVPAFGGSAITSGGILTASGWRKLRETFLADLEAAKQSGKLDGAFFSLHGAMQAEDENDPEGFLLQAARELLGPHLPIVVSLDLHGILTDRMLRYSDAVVPYHTYPHVDFYETGSRAARVLLRCIHDGAKPLTARVKIPALVRGDELITDTGSIRHAIQLAQQMEATDWGLSAGVMWGNPFTDVPELRTNAFVVVDRTRWSGTATHTTEETPKKEAPKSAAEQAAAAACQLANLFWQHHEKMVVPLTSLSESVRLASQTTTGTVILMDAADATSSGASGDSNAILGELIAQQYRGRALLPLIDPQAVQQAFAGGVGSTIQTELGGAFDRRRFTPLRCEARVRMLSDGKFFSESFRWPWDSGPTAVLEVGTYTIIVGTRPISLFDRSWFLAHGQDPQRFDLVVVKSPHCEHHMFDAWCARRINVDAPGSTSANVKSLGHTRCERPMFPLDEFVPFTARADLFGVAVE